MHIVSVYTNFGNKGGAQQVALQLAHCLTGETRPLVLTRTPLDLIVADYQAQAEFKCLSVRTLFKMRLSDTLFISHDRKSTTYLMLLKRCFMPRLQVLHVAHSVHDTLRWATLLPHNLVAVSVAAQQNLVNYFGVNERYIRIIYNGIHDEGVKPNRFAPSQVINILFAAQVYPLKQQVALARFVKGKLPTHVHIYFAGDGVDSEALKTEIKGCNNLHYLGHINIKANIEHFHYTLLFSQREGLPITLIESCMYGLPMITNQLPAMLEVNINTTTGFAYHDFAALLKGVKHLPLPDTNEYKKLSINARERYEKLFNVTRMIDEYRSVLAHI